MSANPYDIVVVGAGSAGAALAAGSALATSFGLACVISVVTTPVASAAGPLFS